MSAKVLLLPSSPVPSSLTDTLTAHLPYSLVLLRRLQFASFPGGTSPHGKILISSPDFGSNAPKQEDLLKLKSFTASYFDLSSGPDTQMYLYSTLQDDPSTDISSYRPQLTALIDQMVQTREEYGKELIHKDGLLLGSLHTDVRNLLQGMGRITPRPTGMYDKWLIRIDDLSTEETGLEEGLRWADATFGDCETVVLKTSIPRTPDGLMRWPSVFIKRGDAPIAWAFLGQDASLTSLHVEPEFRRRGLAKLLVTKLFCEKLRQFGDDGWASSDVSADNEPSKALCQSLKGTIGWEVSWILLDLDRKE